MKQTMRYMIVIALLLSSMMTWADDRVVIVAPTNGTVAVDKANPTGTVTVTLTVTPTAGQYFITLADIKVEKTASVAQTRADGPAIVETIDVKAGAVDDTGKGTYTFSLPDGFGARVSATFTECATFVPVITIAGWAYGETAKAPSLGDTNKSGGTVTYTYSVKDANSFSATVPTAVGDYTVKASIPAKGHYKAAEATKDFTITKKDIIISGIKAADKEYDGTKAATLDFSSVVFGGIVTGDELTVTATGAFEDEKPGENKKVIISDLKLAGKSIDSYQLAATGQQTSTTATITAIPPEEPESKIVDKSKPVLVGGSTFYELTEEILEATKKTITAHIALPAEAEERISFSEDGEMTLVKGDPIQMAVLDLKYHNRVKFFFMGGRLYGDGSVLTQTTNVNGTRAANDLELYSGIPYEVEQAGDIIVTFVPFESGMTMLAAYISTVPDSEETTGIESVETVGGRDAWYDLQGLRIKQPVRKGLYIQDGKKVIVR